MRPSSLPQRLLFLQNTSLLDGYGGVEYYQDDLLTLLAEILGTDRVTTLTAQRRHARDIPQRPYALRPIPFRGTGLLGKIENRLSPRMLAAAFGEIRRQRPDFLVAGHVSLGPLVHLLSRVTGTPYVTCVYGIDCWGKLPWPEEHSLRHSKRIWSISRWTRQQLVRRGFPETQVAVIHPRLPADFETAAPPAAMPAEPSRPFRLLTISRLDSRERYKGQDHVIEALAALKRTEPDLAFRYTIQGDGDDRPRLEQLAAEKGLGDRVVFLPSVGSRTALEALYRDADCFVMPSRFGFWEGRWRGEGFGIVYVEAGAFGVPSVAYDCGGATDIIENGVSGILVKPDDTDQLGRTLSFLARNPKRLRELGRGARETALRDFSRPAIREEIQRALSGLGKDRATAESHPGAESQRRARR